MASIRIGSAKVIGDAVRFKGYDLTARRTRAFRLSPEMLALLDGGPRAVRDPLEVFVRHRDEIAEMARRLFEMTDRWAARPLPAVAVAVAVPPPSPAPTRPG